MADDSSAATQIKANLAKHMSDYGSYFGHSVKTANSHRFESVFKWMQMQQTIGADYLRMQEGFCFYCWCLSGINITHLLKHPELH